MAEKERLQKVIAQSGITSRRKAEELILSSRVKVNGVISNVLGVTVSEDDVIEIDGKVINREKKVYYLFNKPIGVLCTLSDDRGRPTVCDYFKDVKERVFPVGRLDFNTAGLLVMTNDGELSNLMMHPSSHLNKTYNAKISRPLTMEEKSKLEKGVMLDDGMTAPAKVYIHESGNVSITIHEGRNRQVRRMFESLGIEVIGLIRTSIGFIKLDNLERGKYKELSYEDVCKLKEMCLNQKSHNNYKRILK